MESSRLLFILNTSQLGLISFTLFMVQSFESNVDHATLEAFEVNTTVVHPPVKSNTTNSSAIFCFNTYTHTHTQYSHIFVFSFAIVYVIQVKNAQRMYTSKRPQTPVCMLNHKSTTTTQSAVLIASITPIQRRLIRLHAYGDAVADAVAALPPSPPAFSAGPFACLRSLCGGMRSQEAAAARAFDGFRAFRKQFLRKHALPASFLFDRYLIGASFDVSCAVY